MLFFSETTAWGKSLQEVEVLVVVEVGIRLREIQDLPSQDKDMPEAGTRTLKLQEFYVFVDPSLLLSHPLVHGAVADD